MSDKTEHAMYQHLLDMLGAKDYADAGRIIGELHAGAILPKGFVLVPMEPTPQMLTPFVHRADHWSAGKRLQNEQLTRSTKAGNYGYQPWMIPPKTEYEVAAGQYLAMLDAVRRANVQTDKGPQ